MWKLPFLSTSRTKYSTIYHFMKDHFIKCDDSRSVDVVEICGGAAQTSVILIKRRYIKVGQNFDSVVGVNFMDQQQIAAMWQYFKLCTPLVAVISTPCKGLKGWAINRVIAPDAWHRSRETSILLGHLGRQVALHQLKTGRHFISEHLQGSELYQI